MRGRSPRLWWVAVGALGWFLCVPGIGTRASAQELTTLELYTRPGCPHCTAAHEFVERELAGRTGLRVEVHDVIAEPEALQRLRELTDCAGIATPGVPTFVVGDRVVVGFDEGTTPPRIRALVAGTTAPGPEAAPVCADGADAEGAAPCEPASESVVVPVVGEVSVGRLGLPLFTVVVGLADGFNPCATWVLLFLLAMLANLKDRARMALIAGTFVAVSGLVYFAFMAAWLTFFAVVGVSVWVRLTLAGVALLIGGLNIKDFFAIGRGPSLAIPESAKPGLYARVRAVLRAENLAGAMAGIVVLAFLVNVVELLCTAGLPALYTAILTSRDLSVWEHYGYLALYIVAYMADDAVLVTVGVVTLSKRRLQERGARWLKLVSGLMILGLGILLLVRPQWLGF